MRFSTNLFSLLFMLCFSSFANENNAPTISIENSIKFIQNKGQWLDEVEFTAPLGTGAVFLENNCFTYVQLSASDLNEIESELKEQPQRTFGNSKVNAHAWRTTFLGANTTLKSTGKEKLTEYYNYMLGNDQSKWAANVPLFKGVFYENLYEGIALKVYSANGNFKYDFIVAPTSDATQIQLSYTGLNGLEIREGNLVAMTSIGEFIENKPYAYQIIEGVEVAVACQFKLIENVVSFEFPNGYDKKSALIIDPILVGATLSGSTSTNFAHCAAYDNAGNIYTAVRANGAGYPTTLGAFQTVYGGSQDVAISKYNPTATGLIYATFIGGVSEEIPHSISVNDAEELFMFGTTLSDNYPTTVDAFDGTGPIPGTGSDIIITHLSNDGTSLIGSTYVGGNDEDGRYDLVPFFGDAYRGEIILDGAGNCYVASCSNSIDFPVTAGAYQEAKGGGNQDAVVFSMSPNLATMRWSTYIGGTGDEGAYGLRLDANEDVYFCGAASNEFMVMDGYQTTYQGGALDAYVIHLIADGTAISESTYWGTVEEDLAYFIDLDNAGNVYLYGRNSGLSIITPDTYSNEFSKRFICEFSPTLDELIFATLVGGSSLVPTGFMVDACDYITYVGHGSGVYTPITDDALYDEGDFYVGVLQPNAVAQEYATLYSGEFTYGGSSHFDRNRGIVYQAIATTGTFTTTPGAYSDTVVVDFDSGVFKIDLGLIGVYSSATPSISSGCEPLTVDFSNESIGLTYQWNFGDGSPLSSDFEPTHTFTDAGIYIVQLIAYNPEGCNTSDTSYIEIEVITTDAPEGDFETSINCATSEVTVTYTGTPGADVLFNMGDGTVYTTTEFTHMYAAGGSYTITLTTGDGVCSSYHFMSDEIIINPSFVDLIFNDPTCYQFSDGSVTIDVYEPTGSETIEITDTESNLLNVGGSNTANVLASGWYYYFIDLGDGCVVSDSIELMDPPAIDAQISVNDSRCYGEAFGYIEVDTVFNWQGDYEDMVYIWAPDPPGISGIGADSLYNLGVGEYALTINDGNGCSRVFDFVIDEPEELVLTEFGFDPAYCRQYGYQSGNGVAYAGAAGGVPDYDYLWTNLATGETSNFSTWGGLNPGNYELLVTDDNDCELIKLFFLDSLNPIANYSTNSNQLETDCDGIIPVDMVFTNLSENYANPNAPDIDTTFFWNFDHPTADWVISNNATEEFTIPFNQSGDYEVCLVAINKNGCTDTSCTTLIICDPPIFTPINVFSPNGDNVNDVFSFNYKSQAVREFDWVIIDRWGVVIATFNSIEDSWDGTDSKGNIVPDGVYFYRYTGKFDTGADLVGQGTITKISG